MSAPTDAVAVLGDLLQEMDRADVIRALHAHGIVATPEGAPTVAMIRLSGTRLHWGSKRGGRWRNGAGRAYANERVARSVVESHRSSRRGMTRVDRAEVVRYALVEVPSEEGP